MGAPIWDGDVLLGKTLPEAQALCPGKRFIVRETNGRFAEGEPRIVRARSSGFKDTDGNGYANLTSAASPLAALKNYPINYENAAGSGRTVVWTADNRPAEPVEPGKADPAKTGDMMVLFTAMTVLSGMGAAYVARKRED